MTADVELLPELVAEGLDYFDMSGDEGDKLYVSVIRQHISARNAEIEALRAEVEFLRRGIVPRDDDMIVPVKLLDEINASGAEWKDRAERLAEAIRAYKGECDNPAKDYVMRAKRRNEMFAALNHTAAQENDDA